MEIGDLVKRKKPFPEEKDQLWLITDIEDIDDLPGSSKFIYLFNTDNRLNLKLISYTFYDSFEKVE